MPEIVGPAPTIYACLITGPSCALFFWYCSPSLSIGATSPAPWALELNPGLGPGAWYLDLGPRERLAPSRTKSLGNVTHQPRNHPLWASRQPPGPGPPCPEQTHFGVPPRGSNLPSPGRLDLGRLLRGATFLPRAIVPRADSLRGVSWENRPPAPGPRARVPGRLILGCLLRGASLLPRAHGPVPRAD